jgi:hypothetical protein
VISVHRATTLSLAAAAALVFASGCPASASAQVYIAKSTPIVAAGTNSTFRFGEVPLRCNKVEFTYSGIVGNKLAKIEMTPAYKQCSIRESEAVVTVEKAHYEFGNPTLLEPPGEFKMKVSIVGETGAQVRMRMTMEGEKCEVTIPAQKLEGESTRFVDSPGGEGAEIHVKLSEIEYKSNNKCGGLWGATGKNGAYEGSVSEKGLIAE